MSRQKVDKYLCVEKVGRYFETVGTQQRSCWL